MDAITALHARRSIRAFTDAAVTDEQVHILLDAAMIAPSAGNGRPWEFIVVRDKKLLQGFTGINPYAGMAPKASVGILVCGNLETGKYPDFWVQDCSAAMQNILLAGTALGLGTVWTGIYPLEDRVSGTRELFCLPEYVVPLGLALIGHPAMKATRLSRFEAEKVHRDRWTS